MASNSKTPAELYIDALKELEKQEIAYAGMKTKDGVNGLKKAIKIEELKQTVRVLESEKSVDILSPGCKTYLSSLYAYEKYGKWSASKDKGNKYTSKGKAAEDVAIELYCKLEGKALKKNLDRIENEFICGTPDLFEGENIYKADYITDIKAPWDIETFIENLGKPLQITYWWQVQGYMAISGAKLADVSFCLVDIPDFLLQEELYRLFKRMNPLTEQDPDYLIAAAQLQNNLTFSDMPLNDRRIKFIVERDDAAIESIYRKVEKCREWLAEIERMHLPDNKFVEVNQLV